MTRNKIVPRCGMPVYYSGRAIVGQTIRDSRGRPWMEKRGVKPEHQLFGPPAWCTDSVHLQQMRQRGAVGLRLITTGGLVWEALLDDFLQHGFAVSRGHGEQTGLALKYWTRVDPGAEPQAELRPDGDGPKVQAARQLALV